MSTVEEIKLAIERLSLSERGQLERWLHGWQDDEWDQQIADHARTGKLNRLLAEVDEDIRDGRLKDLP
jgi:hypothetical protein